MDAHEFKLWLSYYYLNDEKIRERLTREVEKEKIYTPEETTRSILDAFGVK